MVNENWLEELEKVLKDEITGFDEIDPNLIFSKRNEFPYKLSPEKIGPRLLIGDLLTNFEQGMNYEEQLKLIATFIALAKQDKLSDENRHKLYSNFAARFDRLFEFEEDIQPGPWGDYDPNG